MKKLLTITGIFNDFFTNYKDKKCSHSIIVDDELDCTCGVKRCLIHEMPSNYKISDIQETKSKTNQVYVTMDWGGNPTTTKGDGYILPRQAEMILNKEYYPTGTVGEWPCDPETGEKLPIAPKA